MFLLRIILWHCIVTIIMFLVSGLYIGILYAIRDAPESVLDDCLDSYTNVLVNFAINITADAGITKRMIFLIMYYIFVPVIIFHCAFAVIRGLDDYLASNKKEAHKT